jgi:hypothetical protein
MAGTGSKTFPNAMDEGINRTPLTVIGRFWRKTEKQSACNSNLVQESALENQQNPDPDLFLPMRYTNQN